MKSNKTLIMVLMLLAAMFFGYTTFFGGEDEVPIDVMVDEAGNPIEVLSEQDVSADMLALLEKLKSVRMDDSLFSSAAFRALEDKNISIQDEPVGRNNPFAPRGADGAFVPASGTESESAIEPAATGGSGSAQ